MVELSKSVCSPSSREHLEVLHGVGKEHRLSWLDNEKGCPQLLTHLELGYGRRVGRSARRASFILAHEARHNGGEDQLAELVRTLD